MCQRTKRPGCCATIRFNHVRARVGLPPNRLYFRLTQRQFRRRLTLSTPQRWFACTRSLSTHFFPDAHYKLFTDAAQGSLEPAPAHRFQGANPHLRYSIQADQAAVEVFVSHFFVPHSATLNSHPAAPLPTTTSHGGSFQNISATRATNAKPKSCG